MNSVSETYNIKIPHFEGPFDLLLFFIKRDELDIYDIPIAKITDDFLVYVEEKNRLNLDIASEFILMAATLIRIKTKMLLPRKELDEEGNEIDPRTSLVEKLLEYKKLKEVLDEFTFMEGERMKKYNRGGSDSELKLIAQTALVDAELESLNLFKLMKAFNRLIENYKDLRKRKVHTVHFYKFKVKDQKEYITGKLKGAKKISFSEVFEKLENRIHAVITFLAMLELLTAGEIKLIIGQGVNNFWLKAK